MPLITVLRQNVSGRSAVQHERLIRLVAQLARDDSDSFNWATRVSTGSDGRSVAFVSDADGYAGLADREEADEMIRRLFGEGDGNAILESLGEAVASSSYTVLSPREDLSGQVIQLDAPPPLLMVTRLRPIPGGTLGCEDLIRSVVEAAAKVDDERRYNVLQPVIGELGTFTVVQGVTDPARLDGQAALPELLADVYGAAEGQKILAEGTACIQEAQTSLSVLREDLSNLV
ncbi:MAG: hypothetical protein GY723_03940 [bacterium]|nr:hypothetical protein [bacterium]MCP5067589.1 hypothetical protein [bacterium]